MSMLFAATYPQRVRSLIIYGTRARRDRLWSENWLRERIALIDSSWGPGELFGRFARSNAADEVYRRSFARWERAGASPVAMIQQSRMNADIDIPHLPPAIHVPTLIMYRIEYETINIEEGRYLANQIAGATSVELPGNDHFPYYDYDLADRMVDEVEQFLTGTRSEVPADRDLATVLFTDIVDSTGRAARLGSHAGSGF